jgi:hypothetical protein
VTAPVATVDPVAIAVAELQGYTVLLDQLGAGGAAHVSGLNEAPYCHLQVTDSAGGDDGRLLWTITGEVNVLCWGHPGGRPGPAELRRLLYVALARLARMPDRRHVPGRPVVSDVRVVGSARSQPHPATGQPCYAATVLITASPDNAPGT